jgi:leucyl-tRNA synthetase
MLSDSPPERDLEWTDAGVEGAWRFVNRLWRMVAGDGDASGRGPSSGSAASPDAILALRRQMHRTIARVTDDLEKFGFNRAVARIREFTNAIGDFAFDDDGARQARRDALTTLVILIGPIMPHLAEELWSALGSDSLLVDQPWPVADPALLAEETVKLGVQVNGKLRGTVQLARDASEDDVRAAALALPTVAAAMSGRSPRSVIVVPNRIVNVVV